MPVANVASSLGVLLSLNRQAELAQLKAQQQCQLMQAKLEVQCRNQLQSEYHQAQMMGALMTPIGMKDATFNSLANAVPMAVLDSYGRGESEIAGEGDQIIYRIMFWQQIPLIGRWVASLLAGHLDRISDLLERATERGKGVRV